MKTSGIRCLKVKTAFGYRYLRLSSMTTNEVADAMKDGASICYADPSEVVGLGHGSKPETPASERETNALPKRKVKVEAIKDKVVKAPKRGPLEPGERVTTKRGGKTVKGTFLVKAGGKDAGKLRVKIDGDSAKYREVQAKDTKREQA